MNIDAEVEIFVNIESGTRFLLRLYFKYGAHSVEGWRCAVAGDGAKIRRGKARHGVAICYNQRPAALAAAAGEQFRYINRRPGGFLSRSI
jgi:hypothetical protein